MKRLLLFPLCLAILFACFGCSAPSAPQPTSAISVTPSAEAEKPTEAVQTSTAAVIDPDAPSWQKKTDPVTMTFSSSRLFVDKAMKPWGEDPVSRMIMNLTGVTLVPEKGLLQVNTMTGSLFSVMEASGEFSDLVYLDKEADLDQMGNSTFAAPLDELAAQYCPDFWNEFDDLEILNNTRTDGHIYTLRTGYYNQDVYDDETMPIAVPSVLSLRTDKLKALGQAMPTSIEELEKLLYLVKEKAADVGITAPLRQLNAVNSPIALWMGLDTELRWDAEAKSIRTPMSNAAWLDYLMMMNRWYRDGILVLPETEVLGRSAAQNTAGVSTFLRSTADTSLATAATGMSVSPAWYTLRENADDPSDPPVDAILTQPLTWEGEVRMAASDHDIGTVMPCNRNCGGLFISATSNNKERAILFMQFLRSEDGAKLTHWGIEGEHYEQDQNGHVTMKEGHALTKDNVWMHEMDHTDSISDPDAFRWKLVENPKISGRFAASPQGIMTNSDVITLRSMLIEAGVNYKKYAEENKVPVFSFAEPEYGSQDYDAWLALQDAWYTGTFEMVKSSSADEAQQRWNDMHTELEQLGLRAIEQGMTVRFTDALKRYHEAGYFTEIQP